MIFSLLGCKAIQDIKDDIAGATNPLVVNGIVLSIEAPSAGVIDLSKTKFGEGTAASIFVAEANNPSDIENSPASGADVTVDDVTAAESDPGVYKIEPGELEYDVGALWDTEVADVREEVGLLSVELPPVAAVDDQIPLSHGVGEDIELDFTALGVEYDSVLVVVLDSQTGQPTFSNEPTDAREAYDMTHGDGSITSFLIPGEAFPDANVYAVGISGNFHSAQEDMTEVNTVLSTVLAGKMRFYPVCTLDSVACDAL